MEDAATAEISRTQIWQWRHHGVRAGRRQSSRQRTDQRGDRRGDEALNCEADRRRVADACRCAARCSNSCASRRNFEPFLTLPAYGRLLELENRSFHTNRSFIVTSFRRPDPFRAARPLRRYRTPLHPQGRGAAARLGPHSSTRWPSAAPTACGSCCIREDVRAGARRAHPAIRRCRWCAPG